MAALETYLLSRCWAKLERLTKRSISLSACVFFLTVGITVAARGLANAQVQPSSSLAEEEKLERDFTDPLSTLPQLIIRDSYTPANYGPGPCTPLACPRDYETNQLIVRPLIPRVPPFALLPFNQLIRPTLALVTVPSSRDGTRTEFGDLPVFDIAVLPWPDRRKTELLIGIGPTFVFPTATSKSAGQGAWQAGPALGAIYTGIPGLLVGFIAQNPVSFEYTSPNRPPWAVLAPTTNLGQGALAGHYGGATASAAVGVGAGANVLVGGFNSSIALQPVSIEGQNGLNVAAGVMALNLTFNKEKPAKSTP